MDEQLGLSVAVSDNGWVDHELFIFFHQTNAVSYRPLPLLLDDHSTHFELKSLELAR